MALAALIVLGTIATQASTAVAQPPGEPAAAEVAGETQGAERVTRWIRREIERIATVKVNPPQASRELAILSVAIERALRAGRGRPEGRLIDSAARTVLRALAGRDGGAAPEPGSAAAIGAREAEEVLSSRASDRLGATVNLPDDYPPGLDPEGLWIPTPPAFAEALEPAAGAWRTWNFPRARRYLPDGPPSGSPDAPDYGRFVRQAHRVYNVSRTLSGDQKLIADSWAGGPGTSTPPGIWNLIAIRAVDGEEVLFEETAHLNPTGTENGCDCRGYTARKSARLFAALNSAQADAFIVAWKAKYLFWLRRPITWIRDHIDPDWLSYVPTPPFPSYISGHSTVSGAAARVLAGHFPSRADQIRRLAREAMVSRLYGGIHYHADNIDGLRVGRAVGAQALR